MILAYDGSRYVIDETIDNGDMLEFCVGHVFIHFRLKNIHFVLLTFYCIRLDWGHKWKVYYNND